MTFERIQPPRRHALRRAPTRRRTAGLLHTQPYDVSLNRQPVNPNPRHTATANSNTHTTHTVHSVACRVGAGPAAVEARDDERRLPSLQPARWPRHGPRRRGRGWWRSNGYSAEAEASRAPHGRDGGDSEESGRHAQGGGCALTLTYSARRDRREVGRHHEREQIDTHYALNTVFFRL